MSDDETEEIVEEIQPLAYSVDEAADMLGVCRTTIFNEIKSGDLRSFKIGRRRLISEDALEDYIQNKEIEAARKR